ALPPAVEEEREYAAAWTVAKFSDLHTVISDEEQSVGILCDGTALTGFALLIELGRRDHRAAMFFRELLETAGNPCDFLLPAFTTLPVTLHQLDVIDDDQCDRTFRIADDATFGGDVVDGLTGTVVDAKIQFLKVCERGLNPEEVPF